MTIGKVCLGAMILVILACGGGGGGGGSAGNGPPVPDAQRESAIKAVNTKFKQLLIAGGSPANQNVQLSTFMAAMPEFEAAGVSADAGCAWGRFTDGRLLIVGNNRFPDRSVPDPFTWSPRPRAAFVAKSKQARLMHAFGPNFSQLQLPIVDMGNYLKTDGQFTIASGTEGDARLSTLRAVSGDAFYYLNAHGGKGTTKAGVEVFCAASSTPQNAGTDALPEVKQDFDDNLIVYYTGLTGDVPETVATTYAITPAFIRKYMSFSPNAIVFLNVCFTGNVHPQAGVFRKAFLDKGAGVVLGWTELCNSATAFDAARYFVDRLVAANTFQKENPTQRAFGVNAVLADMKKKGKDKDGPSTLIANYRISVTDVQLRPTIERMFMDEFRDVLVLIGKFGDETGQVKVNNVPVALVGAWTNDVLEVRIPVSGAGAEGPVTVKVHDKVSKERWLTSWRSTFTFILPPGGGNTLKETATLTAHIRLDVDDYRDAAGGVIKPLVNPVGFSAAKDSVLTWSCSGESRSVSGVLQEKWSGGGQPPLLHTAISTPVNGFNCLGVYDPNTKFLSITMVNGGPKTIFRKDQGTTLNMPLSSGGYQKGLDPNWFGPVQDFSSGTTTIKWSQFIPQFPPPNAFYRPK